MMTATIPLDPATLQAIEAQRKEAVRLTIAALGIAGVLLLLAVLTRNSLFMFGAFLGGVPGYRARKHFLAYQRSFKRSVVNSVVQHIAPGSIYRPSVGIECEEFAATYLYTTSIDRYKSSDLVTGKLGNTEFGFAQVHAEKESRTSDADGNDQVSYDTIFQGLLFVGDFHKHFQGHTLIYPDAAEARFGRFGQKLQALSTPFKGAELVKLEDLEFERLFVVYSNNQVEARYLLSPGMMQRLTDFRLRLKKGLRVAFCNGQMYVALSGIQLVRIPFWSSVLKSGVVEPIIDNLRFALSLIEEFNLNTRIWSKV